jgi:hypothetical protein
MSRDLVPISEVHVRFAALSIVVLACLAVASPAAAHSRAPTVALDYRLELSGTSLPGVHAEVVDGDRALRVSVDPPHTLVVLGLLDEPLLRFGPSGVWVNRASPSADADRLTARGSGWLRLTERHRLLWHDHRLAPPATLRAGATAPWSLPVALDGRRTELAGTFVRVARPMLWPWLAGGLVAVAALGVFARARPRRRAETAAAIAGVAAAAALAASAAFATGDVIARRAQWIEVGSAGLLAVLAAAALLLGDRSLRTWAAMVVGVVAAALGLGSLSVFWHGVVISSLPASLARLTTAVAFLGGAVAVVLAILTPTNRGARR